MATIGLKDLYYAPVTEDGEGNETYETPKRLAKAISAELSVELAEAILYADDGPAEVVKEFQSGTLTLGVDNLSAEVAAELTGATLDKNKALVASTEDSAPAVAIAFKAKRSNGKYSYYWLYKVKFGVPSTNLQTKGESITFSTPSIEGSILRRNKPDASGKHPWKAEITEGEAGVENTIITNWYKTVYEPNFASSSRGGRE